jgi:hypothetical protein
VLAEAGVTPAKVAVPPDAVLDDYLQLARGSPVAANQARPVAIARVLAWKTAASGAD